MLFCSHSWNGCFGAGDRVYLKQGNRPGWKMIRLSILIGLAFATPAMAADVDWKWYGGAKSPTKGQTHCFYEERGINRPKPNAVRVWVKCLPQSQLDGVTDEVPYWRAFIDMSSSRLLHYYYPPIFKVERIKNKDQVESVIMYETLADVSDINADAQILYELDCGQRKIQELHISVANHTTDVPTPWKNIPPEGNAANLAALLCPTR